MQNMSSSSSSESSPPSSASPQVAVAVKESSDRVVGSTMRKGAEQIILQTGVGLVVGGLAGVVLFRGGGPAGARKILAGLGAGVGLGSAWTRTSMNLEEALQQKPTKKQ